MLDELLEKGRLTLSNKIYRYMEYKIFYGEYFTITEDEAQNGVLPGNIIWRNGEPFIMMGDPKRIQINSSYLVENWDV
jgi:hypothetical protein